MYMWCFMLVSLFHFLGLCSGLVEIDIETSQFFHTVVIWFEFQTNKETTRGHKHLMEKELHCTALWLKAQKEAAIDLLK